MTRYGPVMDLFVNNGPENRISVYGDCPRAATGVCRRFGNDLGLRRENGTLIPDFCLCSSSHWSHTRTVSGGAELQLWLWLPPPNGSAAMCSPDSRSRTCRIPTAWACGPTTAARSRSAGVRHRHGAPAPARREAPGYGQLAKTLADADRHHEAKQAPGWHLAQRTPVS